MRQNHTPCRRHHCVLWLTALAMLALAALVSGCDMMGEIDDVLYPTATLGGESPQATALPVTPAGEPPAIPTAGPTLTWPAPTHTPLPNPPVPPTPVPPPSVAHQMVFALNGGIYRGDGMGASAIEVASVPDLAAWGWADGVLAIAEGRHVDIIDLNVGQHVGFDVNVPQPVHYAEVLWGTNGASLLYAASHADEAAPTFGTSLALRAFSPVNGAELAAMGIPDASGATLLRYDENAGRISLIPWGNDPSFGEVEHYDLASGQLVGASSVQGEGEPLLSPSGRYLLANGVGSSGEQRTMIYDLQAPSEGQPRVIAHPESTHSVDHAWSHSEHAVAYLLRSGRSFAEAGEGIALMVYDLQTGVSAQVMAETAPSSSLVGWSPDDAYLVGRHRGSAEEDYFYAIRPDGGDRRILTLDSDTVVLGWMAPSAVPPETKIVVDPWRSRFAETAGDPAALADVAAQFVTAQVHTDDQALSKQLSEHLSRAGWDVGPSGARIMRLAEGTFAAQLPPMGIYVLAGETPQQIAVGNVILDARLVGDELGLVFGTIGATAVQPAYALFRHQGGLWRPVWMPQGQRDWISTDGAIRFVDDGLNKLSVSGTSFGLDFGDDVVLAECHACPHRHLVATWVREGDIYVRQSELADGASLADILWEMTQPTAYAITHESLARMRAGGNTDHLVASPQVVDQVRQLGLLEQGLRLVPEEETIDTVRFVDVKRNITYAALVQGQRLVRVEVVAQ